MQSEDVKRAGSREDEQQEQQEPLVGQPHIYGFDACHHRTDLDVGDENAEIAPPRVSDSRHASASRAKVSSGKIQLILKSGGIVKRRDVDLRRVQNISDLRALSPTCARASTPASTVADCACGTPIRVGKCTLSAAQRRWRAVRLGDCFLMPKDETDPEGRRSEACMRRWSRRAKPLGKRDVRGSIVKTIFQMVCAGVRVHRVGRRHLKNPMQAIWAQSKAICRCRFSLNERGFTFRGRENRLPHP